MTDDGEFGCGATIAKFSSQGYRVVYVAFSAAEQSVLPHLPRDILRKEVLVATSFLGIKNEDCLVYEFEVRRFSDSRQEILDLIIKINYKYMPSMVFLPSINDTHQDHHVIATEGFRAFKHTTMLGYEVPWNNLNFKNGIIKKFFLNLFIFVIFLLIFNIMTNILNEYNSQKLQDLINLEINTRADKKRLELLLFGINGIIERPVGHGLTNFLKNNPLALSTHNTYLQLLYELGIIMSILIFWIFFSLKKCIKLSRIQKNYYNLLLSLIILIFFIQLIVNDSLGTINVFIVLGFLIYLSSNRKFNYLQKIT
jgi:hypothetical protein